MAVFSLNVEMNNFILISIILSLASFCKVQALRTEELVGGYSIEIENIPFVVIVKIGNDHCTGVIIDKEFVLTATHCVTDKNKNIRKNPIKVIAGANSIYTAEGTRQPITARVKKVYILKEISKKVKGDFFVGDIAVLQLQDLLDVTSTIYVRKIDLPKKGDEDIEASNKHAVIAGYGFQEMDVNFQPKGNVVRDHGNPYGQLRYGVVNVLTKKECQKKFTKVAYLFFKKKVPVPEGIFCAQMIQRDRESPEGVCAGDSGGPLVYEKKLYGLISSGPLSCDESNAPSVYVEVASYRLFIKKVMKNIIDDTIIVEDVEL